MTGPAPVISCEPCTLALAAWLSRKKHITDEEALLTVKLSSAFGSGTSMSKMHRSTAQAKNKESWAQWQIGPTLEVMRGKDWDPAPISINEKVGRATNENADTADHYMCEGWGVTEASTPYRACDVQICLCRYWRDCWLGNVATRSKSYGAKVDWLRSGLGTTCGYIIPGRVEERPRQNVNSS